MRTDCNEGFRTRFPSVSGTQLFISLVQFSVSAFRGCCARRTDKTRAMPIPRAPLCVAGTLALYTTLCITDPSRHWPRYIWCTADRSLRTLAMYAAAAAASSLCCANGALPHRLCLSNKCLREHEFGEAQSIKRHAMMCCGSC